MMSHFKTFRGMVPDCVWRYVTDRVDVGEQVICLSRNFPLCDLAVLWGFGEEVVFL